MPVHYLLVIPLALVCEFIDSTFGMGYGTTLTPILLLLGFEPLQVVPAVLLSEFVTGILAASYHHSLENVNFSRNSIDRKVAAVLSSCAVVGAVASVMVAVRISPFVLKVWIGSVVLVMGIVMLATLRKRPRFSWAGIVGIGALASFNKGMSGGGYGPLVMGGQVLSGIGVKNAVGITSLSEGLTSLVGVIAYFALARDMDWIVAPWIMAGAVLSVPLCAHVLKRLPETGVKLIVGFAIISLGLVTLCKTLIR